MVKPVAKLKAAPGFLKRVNCRKEPRIFRGVAERFASAQFLVKKSIAQITSASEKRRGTSGFRRTLAPLFLLLADHAESRAWKYL